ncbi:MAG: threonine/serine dehydratase [Alphaproteobacteria bacterium]|nr:threonine/serine dehydratase [Alphaproteobacteria bacterium]
MTSPSLPVYADVLRAAERLRGHAVLTPLLESAALNKLVGGRVLVKAEVLQVTGSFKFRGAYNKISQLSPEDRERGVVAFSSGNHAQGVAAAANLLGASAKIVMPADAPAVKRAGTEFWGAAVVPYDRVKDDREAMTTGIAKAEGRTIVRPYDDPDIMAGQGTAGLEIVAQADAARARVDAVLVPCGGGGLVGGISIAIKERWPATEVYCVEPDGFDDTARSLKYGTREGNRPGATTIADALMAPAPGDLTFAVNRRNLAGGLVVRDDEMLAAMAAAFQHLKLVIEPGGAVALAAVLAGHYPAKGRTVVVVASGGNVDPATYGRALGV